MNVQTIVGSKLAAAEASFKSAFGVLDKIQTTAENAALEATNAEDKAAAKRDEYAGKAEEMSRKRSFYLRRSKLIANFIAGLD